MVEGRVALVGVIAAWAAVTVPVAAHGEPRAVVELFTSQGCSSCPAADRLLGDLSEDPSVIALSLPITLWDYLGWKDTLASEGHTNRQRAYSRERGDGQVYTPQVVVDGTIQAIGSDRSAIEAAIERGRKQPDVLSLPLLLSITNGEIKVSAQNHDLKTGRGEIWLCPLSKTVSVAIGRGENHGRTVTYHNVVRRWLKLGEWTGAAGSWTVPLKDIESDEVDEVAVVVQAGTAKSPGSIIGAAMTSLH